MYLCLFGQNQPTGSENNIRERMYANQETHADANRNAPKPICPPIRLGNEFLCTVRDGINAKIFRGMLTVKSLLKKSYACRKYVLYMPHIAQ